MSERTPEFGDRVIALVETYEDPGGGFLKEPRRALVTHVWGEILHLYVEHVGIVVHLITDGLGESWRWPEPGEWETDDD